MDTGDLIYLGLKSRVAAVDRRNGRILWSVDLPAMLAAGFVTLASDGTSVFAYASGHLCCLRASDGQILWINDLKGYGYGYASICIPGQAATPDPAVIAKLQADARARRAPGTAAGM